jgi:nucleoid-associated protein YgaU
MMMREQSSYNHDLEHEEFSEWELEPVDAERTRILWGRVVALVLALALAFALGRTTGSVGASPERIDQLEAQLAQAQRNIDELEATLAERETADQGTTPEPPRDEKNAEEQQPRTYVVKPGDTLRDLAVRFYGDVDLARLIVRANDISDTDQLRAGQTLRIPPPP